jgi:hypothetical protein
MAAIPFRRFGTTYPIFKSKKIPIIVLDFFTLEDEIDTLFRNVVRDLPIYAA